MRAALPIVLGAIAAGALTRLLAGTPLLQTDLASSAPAPRAAPAGTPESTVAAFYQYLAEGRYDKAWEVSVEPRWAGAAEASYIRELPASASPAGWTPESLFVSRCSQDAGDRIKIRSVSVERLNDAPHTPEARAAAALSPKGEFGVRASGQMLGACLIYRWDRDLAVAEIGGEYKVVLPGTKPPKGFHHQAWFSDVTLVGPLRTAGK